MRQRSPLLPIFLIVLVDVMGFTIVIPLLSLYAERFGKPLLLISQAGTCAGFLLLGVSNSLWMVFIGRILDGITAGNLSTAQAYISDHTAPENRAKAFGVIGVAFGIGFTFGPLLGGWLGHEYDMHVPFLVSAGLSALSIFCTYTLLPKELPPQERPSMKAMLPLAKPWLTLNPG